MKEQGCPRSPILLIIAVEVFFRDEGVAYFGGEIGEGVVPGTAFSLWFCCGSCLSLGSMQSFCIVNPPGPSLPLLPVNKFHLVGEEEWEDRLDFQS